MEAVIYRSGRFIQTLARFLFGGGRFLNASNRCNGGPISHDLRYLRSERRQNRACAASNAGRHSRIFGIDDLSRQACRIYGMVARV